MQKVNVNLWLALFLLYSTSNCASSEIKVIGNYETNERLTDLDAAWYRQKDYGLCHGFYKLPNFKQQELTFWQISANETELHKYGESTLKGDVLISRPFYRVFADEMKFFRNEQEKLALGSAFGSVLLETPSARILSTTAEVDLLQRELTLQDSKFHYYPKNYRGFAGQVYARDEIYIFTDSAITSCNIDENFWWLKANKIILDNNSHQGQAFNAAIYIKQIPIFYTPYLHFPLGNIRQSGFLSPSYKQTNKSGLSISVPYYFNLAPNYDLTFTPSLYSKRGIQYAGEFRFLTQYWQGNINADWLPEDKEFSKFKKEVLIGNNYAEKGKRLRAVNKASEKRGSFRSKLNSYNNPNWFVIGEYNYVSDDNYLNDLKTSWIDTNNQQIKRELAIRYENLHWLSEVKVQNYKTLQPFDSSLTEKPYKLVPQFNLQARYPNFWQALNFNMFSQFTNFQHDRSPLTGLKFTEGNRTLFIPDLNYDYRLPYFYFTPKLSGHFLNYDLQLNPQDKGRKKEKSPNLFLPIYSLETGFDLMREVEFLGKRYTQTLEPKLSYLYIPYRNQNNLPNFDTDFIPLTADDFLRTNRFTGLDRIGDANRLGVAVDSYLLDQIGEQAAHLQVGQLFHFQDRKVSVCDNSLTKCLPSEDPNYKQKRSNIFTKANYKMNSNWNMQASMQFEPNSLAINSRYFQLQYLPNDYNDNVINLAYLASRNNNDNNLTQLVTSTAWRLNKNFRALGQWYFDLDNKRSLQHFLGLEYDNCCWALRLGNKRYVTLSSKNTDLKFNKQIYFEFILKGLSSFGDGYSKEAKILIPGYVNS